MNSDKDLIAVINRTAFIENMMNQIITNFIQPSKQSFPFEKYKKVLVRLISHLEVGNGNT
jgi:hypothetical protein